MATDYIIHNGELYHYGVKGMKWGVRRELRREKTLARSAHRASSGMIGEERRREMLAKANKHDARVAELEKELAGIKAKKQYDREKRIISKKLNKFGENQNIALSSRNTALRKDKTHADKWSAAFKAGKGSKEWTDWKNYVKDFNKQYKDQYIDAWMKDNNVKKLSDQGRKFVEDNISF